MNDRPLVSIITPTYNHEHFIRECLESVRHQTYTNWEQIVLDDGSTDATFEIVEAMGDERVRIERLDHRGIEGLGRIYNSGLAKCRGELIAILEGDDSWDSTKLAQQVPFFEDGSVLLSWGQGLVVDRAGSTRYVLRSVHSKRPSERFHRDDVAGPLLVANFVAPASTIILKHECLDRIGGFCQPRGVPFVDLPTVLRIAAIMEPSDAFVFVNEVVARWRSHTRQVSRQYRLMASTKELVLEDFLSAVGAGRVERLGIDDTLLAEIQAYCAARSMFAEGIYRKALPLALAALGSETTNLRIRGALSVLSSFLGVDLFRFGHDIPRFLLSNLECIHTTSGGG